MILWLLAAWAASIAIWPQHALVLRGVGSLVERRYLPAIRFGAAATAAVLLLILLIQFVTE